MGLKHIAATPTSRSPRPDRVMGPEAPSTSVPRELERRGDAAAFREARIREYRRSSPTYVAASAATGRSHRAARHARATVRGAGDF